MTNVGFRFGYQFRIGVLGFVNASAVIKKDYQAVEKRSAHPETRATAGDFENEVLEALEEHHVVTMAEAKKSAASPPPRQSAPRAGVSRWIDRPMSFVGGLPGQLSKLSIRTLQQFDQDLEAAWEPFLSDRYDVLPNGGARD